jgi:hypothetical protein
MTEQKPEEYVITESQLQAISWALGKLSKDNQLLKEIRSRPLSEEIRKVRVEIAEELNRQTIGRTKSQIADVIFECQTDPDVFLKSLREGAP